MCNASDGWPRPFAVGVLALGATPSGPDRTAARLDLALDTYKLGYFLIDTIEIDAHGTGYLAAELLVSHATPDALVARGPVDNDWLHALADRHPLAIHSGEEGSGTARDALRERMLRWKRG
jgi:hypothetical protein